ncbi:SAM-dependent methyltransferase [Streptacidiphilus melanogenes]|uniref:SAM-dependent methyltransferase n=1 Tax=Streptacidiphilus melanogenes TaxID=411235 RepID=UPI0005A82DCC|nr:SAM-dependent methyltransferase [Streptacidiphilus melanogenes]
MPGPLPSEVDLSQPNIARMWDYLLGGRVNVEADREAARRLMKSMPELPGVLRANRAFAARAVRLLAKAGIRQFLDLGSGLATVHPAHEVVGEGDAEARVLYVDNDPVVAAHNKLLVPTRTCAVLRADLRDTAAVLESPQAQRLFDLNQPVAVLLIAVLDSLPHADRPADIVARYRDALVAGSCVALTHAVGTQPHTSTIQAARAYAKHVAPVHLRTRSEIAGFLNGWDVLYPGLVPTPDWRPGPAVADHEATWLSGLAAVAWKPPQLAANRSAPG